MSRPIWLKPPPSPGGLRTGAAPARRRASRRRAGDVRARCLDLAALALVLAVVFVMMLGAIGMFAPLSDIKTTPISLNPEFLPWYALRSVLRMLAAMAASLLFTLIYGTLAAKSRRAGLVLIPLLDILQSVPVLGYLSFTVTFFLALFPQGVIGAELAAIFAIFTSQAWNMAFSFYQSLRTVPHDLDDAARSFPLLGVAAVLASGSFRSRYPASSGT